jgi:hypothetical protein
VGEFSSFSDGQAGKGGSGYDMGSDWAKDSSHEEEEERHEWIWHDMMIWYGYGYMQSNYWESVFSYSAIKRKKEIAHQWSCREEDGGVSKARQGKARQGKVRQGHVQGQGRAPLLL